MILVKCLFCSYLGSQQGLHLWIHSLGKQMKQVQWKVTCSFLPTMTHSSLKAGHSPDKFLLSAMGAVTSKYLWWWSPEFTRAPREGQVDHGFHPQYLDTFELSTVATSCVALNQGLYKQAVICFCFFQSKMTETFVYMKCFEEVGGCYSLLFGSSVHHKEASLLLKPGLSWGKSPLGLWIFSLLSHIAAVSSHGYWLHWC